MAKMSRASGVLVAALLAGLGWGTPALAEIKWTMSGNSDCGASCLSLAGNTRAFTVGGVTATASAWSNTGGVSNGTTTPSQGTLETAYLGLYSGGLGVKNRDGGTTNGNTGDGNEWVAPEHSVDNQSRYDSVLFTFSTAIDLNKVEIGWWETDSDITILAYTGAGVPTLDGKTYADLTSNGWSFVGHYTDLQNNSPVNVNPTNITSSYWLIGAYIPQWGVTSYTTGNDYVKLLALYGDKTTRVPEPHALLLLGMAAFGLWATRKGAGKPA
jgi:hypothetical protein